MLLIPNVYAYFTGNCFIYKTQTEISVLIFFNLKYKHDIQFD